MCGIVAYVGGKLASPIIINGLKRLEYRGYDSVGISLLNKNELLISKKKGKVVELEKLDNSKFQSATIGIVHTRWATHGPPNKINAHPHISGDGQLAIIHNGIIENYEVIKKALESKGHVFLSDTDTEVLIHLIDKQ